MKKIEVVEMANIEGGTAGQFISGVCAGIGLATLTGVLVLSGPAGWGITATCFINGIGDHQGWW